MSNFCKNYSMKILKKEYILTKKELMRDFFIHPMRIFFLLSGVFAVIGALLLLLKIGDYILWHQFFFLQLFCGSAFAGFLLSAIPDWMHYTRSLLPFSIPCFILLMLASIGVFFGVGEIFMLLFWVFLCLSCVFLTCKKSNSYPFGVILSLFLIAFVNIVSFYHFMNPIVVVHFYIASIVIIGFRVSLVLGQLALNRSNPLNPYIFLLNPIFKNISYISFVLLGISEMFAGFTILKGFLALGAGLIMIGRIYEWHHRVFLTTHYTFLYYCLLLGTGIFYLLLGINYLGDLHYYYSLLHGITIWSLVGFVFLIFNIASLRHSSQAYLNFPKSSKIGFIILFFAMCARVFLTSWELFYIAFPSFLMIALFITFIIVFYNIYKNNAFSIPD